MLQAILPPRRSGGQVILLAGNTAGRAIGQLSAGIVRGGDEEDQWAGLQNEANLLQSYAAALGVKRSL